MKKTNILILLSDQQRNDTICQAGYPHMVTPNLDRLVKEGTCYINAHTANPVCMPARHDLITGFPARVHGYYGNAEGQRIRDYSVPTLARIFSDNQYRTVAVGKMHFSPSREHHGFNEMYLMEELPKLRQQDQYATYLKDQGLGHIQNIHGVRPHIYHIPQNALMDEAHHGTTWVADRSIDWLKENDGNPFMMMCGFIQPHPPWNIPKEMDGVYDDCQIPDPVPVSRLPFEQEDKSEWFGDADSKEQKEKIRKAYFTAITMVDKSVGRILDYLEETGELDNTLVIYTSDHGEMLQDKGYYSKELPYDGAVRVPLMMRYPNAVSADQKTGEFVDLLDILPTCLDACGISYPETGRSLYGKSLLQPIDREYQLVATGSLPLRWVMCRNKQYKYVYHYMGGYEELYDMRMNEVDNLLNDALSNELQSVLETLRVQAIAYEAEWGIEGGVADGAFIQCQVEEVSPSVRGKFHFWSNTQMQRFFEKDQYDRGATLEQEMKKALSNIDKSGVALEQVFLHEEWVAQFKSCYQAYTDGREGDGSFPFALTTQSDKSDDVTRGD